MSMDDLFEDIPPERILRRVETEIAVAREAQSKGKPFPAMRLTSLILSDGAFDAVPKEIWENLARLLGGRGKKKRGRPTTKDSDLELYDEFFYMRFKQMKAGDAIKLLAEKRNHLDIRSTRRALARGRKVRFEQSEEQHQFFLDECRTYGVVPTGNALRDYPALEAAREAARTGIKSPE